MSPSRLPDFLSPGDEIRIISPASVVEKDYIFKTVHALEKLGYKVSLGNHVFEEYHQFAGEDKNRIEDVQQALDDDRVRAIFCARGGYGSIRIMDKLDFSAFMQRPKWLVGFSDITVFHAHINGNLQVSSIHSPMPINVDGPHFQDNLQQLNHILQGKFSPVDFDYNTLNRTGKSKGILIGGNLSILCNLQSTPFEIDTYNKILFIEDVGEQLYHLDRMLNNLRLSGKLSNLKGMIVGGLTDMTDKKRPFGKSAPEIVADAVAAYDYPVAFNFQAGHCDNNIPFLLGVEIELLVKKENSALHYIDC
jgi:muramoyltetrapeptide carboxypeptidase